MKDSSHKAPPQVADIGHRLRRLRKERGMTQTELARQIGIQQSDLSRMEKGEYRVSLDNLFKILSVFGIAMADFFAEQGAAPASQPLTHTDMQLMQIVRQLSPAARQEVQEFVEFKLRREKAERRGEHDRDRRQEG